APDPAGPPGARRVPRLGRARRRRHRLRYRRLAAVPGRHRTAVAGERAGHRCRTGRADPRLRSGLRRALQPGGHARRPQPRRRVHEAGRRLPPRAAGRRRARRDGGQPHVRPPSGEHLHPRALRRRPLALRGAGHLRTGRPDLRTRPGRPRRDGAVRRRRLHHRGLLLELQHLVRQPDDRRRADAVGHLRRDRAVLGAHVRADAACRGGGRRRRGPRALPGDHRERRRHPGAARRDQHDGPL
ncbi:MAG: Aquaporin Z, partial [uncultured Blastococcus sp.]